MTMRSFIRDHPASILPLNPVPRGHWNCNRWRNYDSNTDRRYQTQCASCQRIKSSQLYNRMKILAIDLIRLSSSSVFSSSHNACISALVDLLCGSKKDDV